MTKSSSKSGAGHLLGSRYANSVISVADSMGVLPSVQNDMGSLRLALVESKDLNSLLGNPVYSKGQQLAAIQSIARQAQFHQVTVNFLGVLAQNNRLSSLSVILDEFAREIERRQGIVEANVVSAFPLTEAQQKNLVDTLSKKTGNSVRLDLQIDKSLLGGMVVTVGSRMIDDSLKTRLFQLKLAMIETKAA